MNPEEGFGWVISKVSAVWAMLGIATWADLNNALAVLFTFSMLCHFWWKNFWRPALERRGWLKPKVRRRKQDDGYN